MASQTIASGNERLSLDAELVTSPIPSLQSTSQIEDIKDALQDHAIELVATPKQSFVLIDEELDGANKDIQEADPVWREELAAQATLAWPIIITFFFECVPGLVCIMLVGHIEDGKSREYVDASTLSNMFTNLTCLSIGFGLTSALDTLCSQAYGANCRKKIGIYLQSGFLVVGAAVIPMFILNWFAEDFLLLFGQHPEVSRLSGEFSRITVFGMPFLLLYEMMRKLLQAQKCVRPMVITAIIGDLVNVGSGYYLTYHTSMGFHGAALSRTLGYATLPVCLIGYLLVTKSHREWWPGWNLREARRQSMLFLRLGFPGLIMMLVSWWGYEVLTLMAGRLPDSVTAVGAHAVIVNTNGFVFMAYVGISVSASVRVGNALGANMPRHARLVCILSMSMVFAVATVLGIFVLILRHEIPRLFVNDPAVIASAGEVMLVFAAYTIIDAANAVVQGIYRGLGHQRVAAWSNAIGCNLVAIPMSALCAFVFHWGVSGLWASFALGNAITLTVLTALLCKTNWPKLAQEAQLRTAL